MKGFEALARFAVEPRRTPDVWFAEAAAVGLLIDLELMAVGAALAQFDRLPAGVHLSVNLSPESVMSPRLAATLAGYPLERIVIEVTEHAPVEDYEILNAALGNLRAQGCRLAIDDAGAGFASLRHILRLAPDVIKLDISLTRGLDHDRARRALATALISFANEIGATIVAEGIETVAEVDALRALGVAFGQGYPSPSRDRCHDREARRGRRDWLHHRRTRRLSGRPAAHHARVIPATRHQVRRSPLENPQAHPMGLHPARALRL